jgi:hypothetical protein
MSQPEQHKPDEASANSIARALARNWDVQVNNDQENIDLELLAAYAEGQLSGNEQNVVEELVAKSPAALEALLFFHRALNVEQGTSTNNEVSTGNIDAANIEGFSAGSTQPAATTESALTRRGSTRRSNALTAVTLMLAAGASFWAYRTGCDAQQVDSNNQALLAQLDTQALDLALARKEQVYAATGGSFRSFPAGTLSPRMIQQAMLDRGPVARGGTPAEGERALRKAAVADAESAIGEVSPTRSGSNIRWNSDIERAAIEIAGGNLEVASPLIDDVEQEYGPESPEVMNLRALHLLARADDGEDTVEQAADQFRELTESHPNFALGWFNYALLVTRVQGEELSKPLWESYLKAETSDELRSAVQLQLRAATGRR